MNWLGTRLNVMFNYTNQLCKTVTFNFTFIEATGNQSSQATELGKTLLSITPKDVPSLRKYGTYIRNVGTN